MDLGPAALATVLMASAGLLGAGFQYGRRGQDLRDDGLARLSLWSAERHLWTSELAFERLLEIADPKGARTPRALQDCLRSALRTPIFREHVLQDALGLQQLVRAHLALDRACRKRLVVGFVLAPLGALLLGGGVVAASYHTSLASPWEAPAALWLTDAVLAAGVLALGPAALALARQVAAAEREFSDLLAPHEAQRMARRAGGPLA